MSAVEFALILPVMLALYLGSFELMQGISLNRMVALTATTVTNLVAQYATISQSTQMPDILAASSQIMAPYTDATTSIVITCIAVDAAGHATVAWSQTLNGTTRATGQAITLPAAFAVPNSTVLLGETAHSYTPILDFLQIGTINLTSSIYMSPRASPTIALVP